MPDMKLIVKMLDVNREAGQIPLEKKLPNNFFQSNFLPKAHAFFLGIG